ncbi:hypothetical protein [Bowmanella denitrificans]|uniref:hypothetical protein n=1 Tax=Bowmanella denitrificans TaxID=366582 RepID=UPI000C9B360C|nr:hypothetical protein [Bowmanella denitrificans]
MYANKLPESILSLFDTLQLVELEWQGRCVQIPKFAVYAILDKPVFDRYSYIDGKRMGIIQLEPYQIPVLDPFSGCIQKVPDHVVVISHNKGNRFGLFGYPADRVRDHIRLSKQHRAVPHIVRAFC